MIRISRKHWRSRFALCDAQFYLDYKPFNLKVQSFVQNPLIDWKQVWGGVKLHLKKQGLKDEYFEPKLR